MRRFKLRSIVITSLSLFGGFCFATAPVASVDVSTGQVAIHSQPTANDHISTPSNTQPTAKPASTPAKTGPEQTTLTTAAQTSAAYSTATATTPVAITQVKNAHHSALLASLTPEQRLKRLENQVQYLSSYNNQLQNLTSEVDTLRGQIEDLSHQVYLLKKKVKKLETDQTTTPATNEASQSTSTSAVAEPAKKTSNTKMQKVTTKKEVESAKHDIQAAKKTPTANEKDMTPPPSKQEQMAFNQAYTLLVKQDYTKATKTFKDFLKQYPKSTLAPNAHYWLGDLYLAQGQPDNASQQYRAVVNVKDAEKRPDAMLKLGTILLAYGDSAHAKQLFQNVVQDYPKTHAAKQAQKRLKSL